MEQAPTDKPERRPTITPCRKCGHTLEGDYVHGAKLPIRTVCPACKDVREFPEVEQAVRKRALAIGTKSAKLRSGKKPAPK